MADKKNRLTTLERTDYELFVQELKQMGIKVSEWNKLKFTIAKAISEARASTVPALSVKELAEIVGVTGSAIRSYESGGRLPILFNLWMIGKATGKRLKISYV